MAHELAACWYAADRCAADRWATHRCATVGLVADRHTAALLAGGGGAAGQLAARLLAAGACVPAPGWGQAQTDMLPSLGGRLLSWEGASGSGAHGKGWGWSPLFWDPWPWIQEQLS